MRKTAADHDHVVFRPFKRADGSMGIGAHTPRTAVDGINSAEELTAQLAHYARGLFNLTTPNSTFARRRYVEQIRPALRYYCKKFGREVPDWLASDHYYTEASEGERTRWFGSAPLRIKEFRKPVPVPDAEPPEGAGAPAPAGGDA